MHERGPGGSVPRCRKRKASGAGRAGRVQSEPTGGNGDVTGAIQSESHGGRFAASFVHLLLSLRHTSTAARASTEPRGSCTR